MAKIWQKFGGMFFFDSRCSLLQKEVKDGRTDQGHGAGSAEQKQAGIPEGVLPERGPHTTARLPEEREIPRTTEDWRVQDDHCAA